MGLAFKLPQSEPAKLLSKGKAKSLKYSPEGHVKRGYALFDKPDEGDSSRWKKCFMMASQQVQC